MARTAELVIAFCLLLVGLLTACQPVSRSQAQLAAQIQSAWRASDKSAFIGLFADSAQDRATQLWETTKELRIDVVSPVNDLWEVNWSVGDLQQIATSSVRPEVSCKRQYCELVDLGQASGAPAPVWLTGDLASSSDGQITVLAPQGQQAQWLAAANSALSQLRDAPAVLGLDLSQPVIVEVPADVAGFEQIMAAPALDFRGTGAITWTAGDDSPSALMHVVVNPRSITGASQDQLVKLLTHEFVHLTTRGLKVSPGRKWVVEGLAELLSAQAEQSDDLASQLLASRCPLAQIVISDDQFSGADKRFAYAWSQWAVSQLFAADPAQVPALASESGSKYVPDDSEICGG